MVRTGEPTVGGDGRGARRTAGVALALAVVAVLVVGCSSDSGGAAPKKTTTTTAVARSSSTTSTTEAPTDPTTTTTSAGATTTVPTTAGAPNVPAGPVDYTGAVDGQDASVEVRFTVDGSIRDFAVTGLSIECQPLDNGDPSTEEVEVAIADAPIRADGSVETTDEDATFQPTLSGSFTDDATFAGALYLTGEDDGSVCGGEFTFLATAA